VESWQEGKSKNQSAKSKTTNQKARIESKNGYGREMGKVDRGLR
jgi:hypothetical protein